MKPNKGAKSKPVKSISSPKSYHKWLLPFVIVVTSVMFYSSLTNGFTNWDDNINVTDNSELKSFKGDSLAPTIKNIFEIREGLVMYAPLVKLSYLAQYVQSRLNPLPYHLFNLLLHLFNTALVFGFVWLLCRQHWVAFITALLFAIHPMHVESVAWITGRIDLLYSFFFMGALCGYLLYLEGGKWKQHFYVITIALFVLSLLCKAAAVTLPVVFLLIEYFKGRKFTAKTVLTTAPFFVLSLIFGYIAIYAQRGCVVLVDLTQYSFFDRILLSFYALTEYLWKLVLPINLACIYDYPLKQESKFLPGKPMFSLVLYATPLIIIALAFLVYRSIRFGKDVMFGFSFFLISIVLVLPGFVLRYAIMPKLISIAGTLIVPLVKTTRQ